MRFSAGLICLLGRNKSIKGLYTGDSFTIATGIVNRAACPEVSTQKISGLTRFPKNYHIVVVAILIFCYIIFKNFFCNTYSYIGVSR